MEPMTLSLMNSRNAWRGTPAFCARTVISARLWIVTPSSTLWAILQKRASSPSPTYAAPRRAKVSISGRASANAASGPEQTALSLPARTHRALPETGAAIIAAPRSKSRARIASP